MLSQISWGSYFEFILIALGVYYPAVIFSCYRGDLKSLLKGKVITLPFTGQAPLHEDDEEINFRSLIDELNAYFEQSKNAMASKEEVINSLSRIISKHPIDKKSFYKVSISNLIALQCENNGSLHLGEADLDRVWKV